MEREGGGVGVGMGAGGLTAEALRRRVNRRELISSKKSPNILYHLVNNCIFAPLEDIKAKQ